jgi:alpha-glucosidase
LLNLYRELMKLRHSHPALSNGGYRAIDSGPDVFGYLRTQSERSVLVVLNFASERRCADLDLAAGGYAAATVVLDSAGAAGREVDLTRLTLEPDQAVVIELPGDQPVREAP